MFGQTPNVVCCYRRTDIILSIFITTYTSRGGGGCSVKRVPIFRYLRLAGLDPAGLRLDNTARGPFLAGPVFFNNERYGIGDTYFNSISLDSQNHFQ